ncbi:MAG: M28 family peptidase [Winogradskyella sp.]|uniref:M28 family peptidase n=1 Tax=Winogradskyella sp. TaxID=1883156 RepID=UPI000F3EC2B3|nr:M28 family peptidase [Winogradskyella sp.]RNC86453.1 MAG: M28 family peptidase [Winogradskyella sp.]
MRKNICFFCTALILMACGSSKDSKKNTKVADPVEYAKTITQDELKTMLYEYASDKYEGRETGEKGQKLAVEYIKNQYLDIGVASAYKSEDFFQEVYLERQSVSEAELDVNGKSYTSFINHIVLSLSKSLDINTSEIIYVGYGIDDNNYSNYKGLDVKGKIVLAKSGEPKDENGNYITNGKQEGTKWTNGRQALSSKRNAARDNGAKVLLYFDEGLFSRYAPFYQRQAESGFSSRLSLKNEENDFAFLMINDSLAKALLPTIEKDSTSKEVNINLSLKSERKVENVLSENVVAFIEGSEKPDEILVISSHLDHIGYQNGEICNGADDDGSGTVALIELAEAFQTAVKDGFAPKRSILFLHVTGEEKGLLGSRYYTDVDPIFPLANTVADLNIDMIGRTDPKRKEGRRNYVYLIGSDKLSTDLHNLSEEINKKFCNIELDYTFNDENDPNRYYYRSDHYNFAKNNIPVIFYFNGTHDDYHRPSDTPDKIQYDLLENRARLVFHTAWEIVNRDKRIAVDKTEDEK